jgi:hypothetical protein
MFPQDITPHAAGNQTYIQGTPEDGHLMSETCREHL